MIHCCFSFVGDLLQLGEEVVFRFNHPEEAQRNKQIVSVL